MNIQRVLQILTAFAVLGVTYGAVVFFMGEDLSQESFVADHGMTEERAREVLQFPEAPEVSRADLIDVLHKQDQESDVKGFVDVYAREISITTTIPKTSNDRFAVDADPNTLVFVFAGQSNMLGKKSPSVLPRELYATPDNVTFFWKRSQIHLRQQPWFGPEYTCAHMLSEAFPSKRIVIIKYAVSDTSLFVWDPTWTPEEAAVTENLGYGKPYDNLVQYITLNPYVVDGNRVDAIFWMQGERDARFEEAARQYGARLQELVDALRKDVRSPSAQFLLGRIATPQSHAPFVETVRLAQTNVSQNIAHAIGWVDTDDLPMLSDGIHYDDVGQQILGRRFADLYLGESSGQ